MTRSKISVISRFLVSFRGSFVFPKKQHEKKVKTASFFKCRLPATVCASESVPAKMLWR